MSLGEVVHVYVVANAGAVGRWVIGAKYFDPRPATERGQEDEWNQVCFRIMILTDRGIRAGARGVEVAQGRVTPPVSRRIVGQRPADRKLRRAVGIDRRLRFLLGNRHALRDSIGCTRARKDEPPY